MVQRRHADSVLHRCGPSILVGPDVRPYQELSHRKSTEGASVSVGGLGASTEPRLVIPRTCGRCGIGDLDTVPHGGDRLMRLLPGRYEVCRCQQDMILRRPEIRDPNWEDRLIHGWRHAHEVNQVRTPLPSLSERIVRWVVAARQLIAQQSGSAVQVRRFGILVAVPSDPAGPWHGRLDAECGAHLFGLEDPLRPVREPDPLAGHEEPIADGVPRHMVIELA